ncbi:hypothetical protein ACIRS1_19520 [Kitasatospora sp. NPDC101176]|uniref:hypothetical protein n=1 Tax=Kitasatospora sp. NPDC101176 TaxID=3364099 RepID=UPI0038134558
MAALSGAPWWAVTLGVIASSGQVLAAVALGIVQSIAPQDSGDRRRVWELLLGDRRPRGSSDDPSPQAPGT